MISLVILVLIVLLLVALYDDLDWRERAGRAERGCERYRRRASDFFLDR